MKVLDKNGLAYFWSKVKGWAMDNIVPLTRKINGKDLSSDITLRAKDIPYESSNVSDTMKDVRNVMLAGDTCTENVYSNATNGTINSQNTNYTKGTAPTSQVNLFGLRVLANGKVLGKLENYVTTENANVTSVTITNRDGSTASLQEKSVPADNEGYLNITSKVKDIYIGKSSDVSSGQDCGETINGTHMHIDGSSSYIKLKRSGTNGPYISMGYTETGFTNAFSYGQATKNRVLKFPDTSGTLLLKDKRDFTVTDPNGVFIIQKAYQVGPLFFMYGYLDYTKPMASNNRSYASGTNLLDGKVDAYIAGINFIPNSSNYKCILRGRVHATASAGTFVVKSDTPLAANQYFYVYGMTKPNV